MSFPDYDALMNAAQVWGFRAPEPAEPEAEYRHELARHVWPQDRVEAYEILFGVSWDRWTQAQQQQALQPILPRAWYAKP